MRFGTRVSTVAAVLLTAAAPAGTARTPEGYAARFRVVAVPGGGIQQLELPPAAIVALRRRDAADVRIFDARDRAVPIARIAPAARTRRARLAASPILGAVDTPLGARASIRFDEHGQARVAEVESAGVPRGDAAVLGALLDARAATGVADGLDLDAEVPAGQPIRFTVEASRDLESWRLLGSLTAYRTPGKAWTGAVIPIEGSTLDHDYLRVTWNAASRLIAPVTIRSAVLATHGDEPRIMVAARAPALLDDHAVEFIAPPVALASLRVVPAPGDGAMRVEILGRDGPEQAWAPLAAGIAAVDASPMRVDGATPRIIRIEADRRGPGFSDTPKLQLGFARQAIAFATSGGRGFTLAAGRADADDGYVELELPSGAAALPIATVEDKGDVTPLVLQAPDRGASSRLRLVLWAALLAAVALLAGLTWLAFGKRGMS